MDWIPGFAAYQKGSLTAKGKAHVVINLGGLLATVKARAVKPKEVPYFVSKCLLHEIVHALQEWAGQAFSEKKVQGLIEKYEAKYSIKTK
jgi:hypothetical protein